MQFSHIHHYTASFLSRQEKLVIVFHLQVAILLKSLKFTWQVIKRTVYWTIMSHQSQLLNP